MLRAGQETGIERGNIMQLRFIKTSNKVPIEKAWNKENNYDLSELIPWIQEGEEIGLVIPKGYIVVDIDNKQTADLIRDNIEMFGKCGVHTTPHGLHLIYKAPKTKIKNTSKSQVMGMLEADYRTSGRGFIVYPLNKDGRHIIRGLDSDFTPDVMPDFFKPIKMKTRKSLLDLSEGSRNDSLYKWACKIGNYDIDLHQVINMINDLSGNPLPQFEIDKMLTSAEDFIKANPVTVIEDEDGKTNFELDVAKSLSSDLWFDHFFFYEWQGTHWQKINSTEVKKKVYDQTNYSISTSTLSGIISKLQSLCYRPFKVPHRDLINTLSGVYNLETKELRPVEKEDNFTQIINAEITDVDTEPLEAIIKTITPDFENLLLMLGHILYKDNRITEQAFLLKGTVEGGNGKDTLLTLLGTVFKYMSIDFDTINTGRFYLANIETYDVLIDTDFNNKRINQSGNFKKIVSGTPLTAEVKSIQTPKEIISNATCIICSNLYPTVDLGSAGGFFRRWTIIKCPYNLYEEGGDPLIKRSIGDGAYNNAFLSLALRGYQMLKERGYRFSKSPDKDYWESLNNPIKVWVLSNYKADSESFVLVDDFYTSYVQMCEADGFNPVNKVALGKILNDIIPIERKRVKNKGYKYQGIRPLADDEM